MAPRKPFFRDMNKARTRETVREIVNPVPLWEEFESELIADLIAEKHYYCSPKGLKPTKFRKGPHPVGEYEFQGFFPTVGRWHPVSWTQCLAARRPVDWIARALRDAVSPDIAAFRKARPQCEHCKAAPSAQVHHVEPTFAEIVQESMDALSEKDWTDVVDLFDWWSPAPFALPANSPALGVLRERHASAKLLAVCIPCHGTLETA